MVSRKSKTNYDRNYDTFLQTVSTQVPSGCEEVSFGLGQLSTSPPGRSSVEIFSEMILAADSSVSDHEVNTTLLLCVSAVTSFTTFLVPLAPKLTNGNDTTFPANSIEILKQQSCCGIQPPPCSMSASTLAEVLALMVFLLTLFYKQEARCKG